MREDELLGGVTEAELGRHDVEVPIGIALGDERQHITLQLASPKIKLLLHNPPPPPEPPPDNLTV
jgi:hypothetical protein